MRGAQQQSLMRCERGKRHGVLPCSVEMKCGLRASPRFIVDGNGWWTRSMMTFHARWPRLGALPLLSLLLVVAWPQSTAAQATPPAPVLRLVGLESDGTVTVAWDLADGGNSLHSFDLFLGDLLTSVQATERGFVFAPGTSVAGAGVDALTIIVVARWQDGATTTSNVLVLPSDSLGGDDPPLPPLLRLRALSSTSVGVSWEAAPGLYFSVQRRKGSPEHLRHDCSPPLLPAWLLPPFLPAWLLPSLLPA